MSAHLSSGKNVLYTRTNVSQNSHRSQIKTMGIVPCIFFLSVRFYLRFFYMTSISSIFQAKQQFLMAFPVPFSLRFFLFPSHSLCPS